MWEGCVVVVVVVFVHQQSDCWVLGFFVFIIAYCYTYLWHFLVQIQTLTSTLLFFVVCFLNTPNIHHAFPGLKHSCTYALADIISKVMICALGRDFIGWNMLLVIVYSLQRLLDVIYVYLFLQTGRYTGVLLVPTTSGLFLL